MSSINTKQVANRRTLSFNSLDDISNEVERLAKAREIQTLGNWSAGQVLKHLAIVMHGAIDGMNLQLPFFMKLMMPVIRFFMKQKFLTSPMPAGYSMSASHAKVLVPSATTWDEGLAAIRSGLQRLKSESKRMPSPFLGELTSEQWTQLQCRHCELHLSFLVPVE